MSSHNQEDQAATNASDSKSNSFFSIGRILLWLVILIGIVVAGLEGWTLYAWKSTQSNVMSAILDAAAKPGDSAIKKDELDDLITGSPERVMQGEKKELITWKGWLREYSLTATYGLGERLVSIE